MLQIKDIRKQYKTGDYVQNALDGVSLELRDNEFVAILGPSGSGKTTLLNIIGGLDRYDSGDLIINGISTKKYKDRDWDAYRNHTIGFVFQSYNLIPHQSVLSNVELALTLAGISKGERKKRAKQALEKVGLGNHLHKRPNQMSGGQMQRVAIARALVNDPEIILADEPTGALDSETSIQVMDLLKEVAKDRLVVMVTHNPELAEEYANRIVRVKDGHIISDSNPVEPHEVVTTSTKPKRTKLRFTTALGLSRNNLMTKKGRTFLTAFAGAIGIIGIALILSLSNGVNDYISSIESDMLGSYPIELEKQTFDMASMMEAGKQNTDASLAERAHELDKIYSNNIVADTVKSSESMTKENDLGKFKLYLEEHKGNISESIAAVEYGYDITPQIFRMDDEEVIQVSPSTLSTSSSAGGMTMGASTSSAWSQLVNDENLRTSQYELLEGEWPSAYDEAALIVTTDNEVSDYTLYTLGLMDMDRMNEIIEAVEDGEDYEDPQETFSYEDVIGLEYQVFAPSELYSKSEDDDAWIDKTEDEEYLEGIYEDGITVKITCVLRATEDADISSGVAYDGKLTEYLMDITVNSDIVKEQLADPETNVLTGEAFEEEEDESEEEETEDESEEDESEEDAEDVDDSDDEDTSVEAKVSTSTGKNNKAASANTLQTSTNSTNASTKATLLASNNVTNTSMLLSMDEQYTVRFLSNISETDKGESIETPDKETGEGTENPDKETGEGTENLDKETGEGTENPDKETGEETENPDKETGEETENPDKETGEGTENPDKETGGGTENPDKETGEGTENPDKETGEGTENPDEETGEGTENPDEEMGDGSESTGGFKVKFVNYDGGILVPEMAYNSGDAIRVLPTENPARAATATAQYIFIGWWSSAENAFYRTSELPAVTSDVTYTAVYYEYWFSSSGNMSGTDFPNTGENSGTQTPDMGDFDMSGMTGDMSGFDTSNIDMSAISGSATMNLSDDQLAVMVAQMSDSTPSTYEEVLSALGYCTTDDPTSIAIYPVDFDGKTAIEGLIEDYNSQMENESDKVTYTDIIGTLTSSITSIVDTISYVLIAFVAISLIVSSIMIAIITYISVLERTKEIGVLRALGASKGDVSKIFNAETFIEGFISGLLGVGTTLLLCIPINSIVLAIVGVEKIAVLPMQYSVGLVTISVILTLIAGFAPSRMAAKKDPVTALRTE